MSGLRDQLRVPEHVEGRTFSRLTGGMQLSKSAVIYRRPLNGLVVDVGSSHCPCCEASLNVCLNHDGVPLLVSVPYRRNRE